MAEELIDNSILQGLCAVIFDDSEKVLMLFRSAEGEEFKTGWEFVKGGVQVGETRLDAAFREILEETGLSDVELVVELPRVYFVDVRYRKKRYDWIEKKALTFFYRGGEVYLDGQEHSQYKWMLVSEAQEVCWVEYGADILREAHNAFIQWRSLSRGCVNR
jgi:8-oxo-dGTP pyrophosphatase MutT (NUDIX family)